MDYSLILALLVLTALLWFWLDSLRARELATAICTHTCQRANVQFLDGTVSLERTGVERGTDGRIHIRRLYRFEFSVEGFGRRRGHATMLGTHLLALDLDGLNPFQRATDNPHNDLH